MVGGGTHDGPDSQDEGVRHPIMKQVRHRVNEDFRGFFQRSGMSKAALSSRTTPFQTVRFPLRRVSPLYFGTFIA